MAVKCLKIKFEHTLISDTQDALKYAQKRIFRDFFDLVSKLFAIFLSIFLYMFRCSRSLASDSYSA
jgi:hypothetical protein